MFKKKIALLLLPMLLVASIVYAYTRDWDETDPIDHTLNSKWPAEIREVMTDMNERLTNIMYGFASGETDEGFKKIPMVVQASDPTNEANTVFLYTKDVSSKAEIFFEDEDGDTMQLTSGGDFIGGISGEIRIWSGSIASIPTGWEASDGTCTNTCPDLRNYFVIGAGDTYSVDDSSTTSTHTHSAGSFAGPSHTHSGSTGGVSFGGGGSLTSGPLDTAHTHSISSDGTGSVTGTSASTSHLPPYYALAYIIKI